MKTIGLIGGLSWESSLEYYRIINQAVRAKLGGLHSAKSLLYSFDFAEVEQLQQQGRWDEATYLMVNAAQQLEQGGADLVIICSNTMHKMADAVQQQIHMPLLHIADATATRIAACGCKRVGLLGTRYTMTQDFYKGRLIERFGLDVLIPDQRGIEVVHQVIYNELCLGQVNADSKERYRQIIADLVVAGAEGIILGCTEITLLIQPSDSDVPVFDTTAIHAEAAVEYAIAE
ncbi:aspartate/glutamate racemase family protein [Oculatella sp. LEGE 06141]|uniref:aspartate/glutamate racemase family protein n=1 Tax=Oculatella sp. LEGE 06141 TaxID=1828648 RepID=UPI0018815FC5|nr:aspartate/glutamate racemase family protein [Oculatella sp. LEGE 06141]MBE9181514.1 aspartate/glutamate racemase family protein [Oculatella sp. LEGE 06141]